MKETIAIIPAAGKGDRMLSLTEHFPKAMLPINQKLTIDYIMDKLIEENIKTVCIVVGYEKEKLINHINFYYKDKINYYFAEQTKINGLPTAIKAGIDYLREKMDIDKCNLLIILGDTIIKDKIKITNYSWVGYKKLKEYKRWCLAKTKFNKIKYFVDKPDKKPNTNKVTIGVYFFHDIQALYQSINYIENDKDYSKNEYQFADVMQVYINNFHDLSTKCFKTWLDCGEINTFMDSRKNLTRYFNEIKQNKHYVLKKSSNINKIKNEILWYLKIKDHVTYDFLPNIIDYDKNYSYYKMNFINDNMLQEIFIYQLLDINEWDNIFNSIKDIFNKFNQEVVSEEINNKYMFYDKFFDRLTELAKDDYWNKLINNDIIINNKKYKSLSSLIEKIKRKLKDVYINTDYHKIIHGDLFFGNMFYNENFKKITLIDPRGSFGKQPSIYGDSRYDIAKLNQSIKYNYDFIVNEMYVLYKINDLEFNYDFFDGKYQKDIYNKFINCFKDEYDFNEIDFITAINLICIAPMHKDNPRNQLMEYLIAIQILNDIIK